MVRLAVNVIKNSWEGFAMKLKGKKILITGADGFIGSHLVEEMIRRGNDVRAFVYYNSFSSWGWLDHAENGIKSSLDVFAGDIRDPYGVKRAMQGCDVVMHLAALIAIPYSYHSPETYVDTNIKGTLNVLQAARDLGVERVIHTSTSEVYGTAQTVPISEDHPLQGQSPYSATKIGADQIALSFFASFETPVSVVRPFNTYGPRQSARAIIPSLIIQMTGKETPVRVKVGSLHPTRDFNYVDDTVRGFIAMAEADRVAGETINLGSNYDISIGDLINMIAELMGKRVEAEVDPARVRPDRSEVERLRADNRKARDLLGWAPEYAGLDGLRRGLEKTIQWFERPENRSAYKANIYNI